MSHCHFCTKSISAPRLLWKAFGIEEIYCPNCQEFHVFHKKHYGGFGVWLSLSGFQPRCEGKWIPEHRNHHLAANADTPNECSRCGMIKDIWDEWYCCGPCRKDPCEWAVKQRLFVQQRNNAYLLKKLKANVV